MKDQEAAWEKRLTEARREMEVSMEGVGGCLGKTTIGGQEANGG